MNEMRVFEEREVLNKQFKIYGTIDNPLFLAKDVAEWIEHSNVTDLVSRVDKTEVTKLNLGGLKGECNFLTEDGLYEVLMQSRKPIAKEFKKQVKLILKDIRKHGMYATDELLSNPDFLIQVATALKTEREKNKVLEQEVEQKQLKIEELKPFADYTSIILSNKGLVNISQIAKDYGTSGNKMNDKLHALHIQYKQGNQWLLYSEHQDKGYTHSITEVYQERLTKMRTKWTQLGRMFIYERLKEENILPLIEQNYEDEL